LSLSSKDPTKQVLDLVVDWKAFSVMVTGEKRKEYCDPTRTFLKRLKSREYEFVKISHGYMSNRPSFTAKLLGWKVEYDVNKSWPNGLSVNGKKVVLKLGPPIMVISQIAPNPPPNAVEYPPSLLLLTPILCSQAQPAAPFDCLVEDSTGAKVDHRPVSTFIFFGPPPPIPPSRPRFQPLLPSPTSPICC
jgi:hypothetical protein